MSGLNAIPQVSVRINEIKADYDEAFEELEGLEYEIEEGCLSRSISIKGGKSIENNPLFKDGKITVQDESAMIIAPLLELEEGMTVIDLCSAPGGKTTHIAEILQNTGKVLAFDLHESKLGLIKENCERLGLTNVEVNTNDATKLNPELIACSDRILLDVPCSGIGIIRKKPEIKWNKTRNDLKTLYLFKEI